jgi:hypothetical protein
MFSIFGGENHHPHLTPNREAWMELAVIYAFFLSFFLLWYGGARVVCFQYILYLQVASFCLVIGYCLSSCLVTFTHSYYHYLYLCLHQASKSSSSCGNSYLVVAPFLTVEFQSINSYYCACSRSRSRSRSTSWFVLLLEQ